MALVPAAAQTPATAGDPPGCAASVCDLTLRDAIGLALARNRPLLNSRLDREVQRFSLDVAEERWSPQVTVGPFASRDRQDNKAGVGARISLRVPTGGAFALGWDETLSRKFDDAGSQTFSFSQPLLKGAWADIDSATVRQARLEERIDILAFRQTAANLVVDVIGAYRALIGAGRVAEREAGRSEAAIATRELALVRARNRLEAAQFALIDILELDSRIRIRPLEELKAGRRDTAIAPNLAVEEAKFGQGLSSTFEVASAEEELVQVEQAEADAILSWLDALTRLDRTTGRVLDRWDVRLEAVPQ